MSWKEGVLFGMETTDLSSRNMRRLHVEQTAIHADEERSQILQVSRSLCWIVEGATCTMGPSNSMVYPLARVMFSNFIHRVDLFRKFSI